MYRLLAAAEPDNYLPGLAMALNNQSAGRAGLNEPEKALEAINEAVTIRRHLADNHPDAYLPDLAASLNNQSAQLARLHEKEKALKAIEDGIAIYRTLVKAHPDTYFPDLATSLLNQSNRLDEFDWKKDALTATAEVVTIRRGPCESTSEGLPPGTGPVIAHSIQPAVSLGPAGRGGRRHRRGSRYLPPARGGRTADVPPQPRRVIGGTGISP
jgi:hypothetical protein